MACEGLARGPNKGEYKMHRGHIDFREYPEALREARFAVGDPKPAALPIGHLRPARVLFGAHRCKSQRVYNGL